MSNLRRRNKKVEPIIEFKNFTFRYHVQSEPTLYDINLKIFPGEKVLILGPSGSGKSTLVHCLNGLIPFAYKGEITGSLKIKGFETRELDIFKLSKIVGTVLQDTDAQFVGLTVGEDIAFALENDNVPHEEMKKRVEEAAKMVGMEKFLNHSPFEISGGQKQRTTIAGVLVDNVDVLLFDEPLANLDPATAKKAMEIIDELHTKTGKTVIIVEHRLEDVLHREIDRVIVLKDGRIIFDSNPHELMESDVLSSAGLREPLYVSALKYSGLKISKEIKPGYISTLSLPDKEKENVRKWFNSNSKDVQKMTDESEPILRVENLNFSYERGKPVLKNINLEIKDGEMISIVGKNGAGKSTFAKVLCGFVKEDSGKIIYKNEILNNMTIKERAQFIGFVMQNPNQMITKPIVYDEIALGLRLRKVPEDVIERKVDEVAQICGLKPFIKWPISALSYGQKKRVTIASILALDPKIIILDEPTAGQDFSHYSEIMEFLAELNSNGITIILITHDMHLIMEYTHRAVVFADGEIVANDEPSKILTNFEVIEKANLKETSLYSLANIVGINETSEFVQHFIDYDRTVRKSHARKADNVHI
ncbi:heme ABC transporter ATP-binding protein [Fervidobacterium riparium]|nr:heme ABC transporter ATP-binding protein [Fervidobacterium riparium]